MSAYPVLSDAADSLLRQLAAASNRLPAENTSAFAVDSGMRESTVTHPDITGWSTSGNWQAMHELEGQGLVTQHENRGFARARYTHHQRLYSLTNHGRDYVRATRSSAADKTPIGF